MFQHSAADAQLSTAQTKLAELESKVDDLKYQLDKSHAHEIKLEYNLAELAKGAVTLPGKAKKEEKEERDSPDSASGAGKDKVGFAVVFCSAARASTCSFSVYLSI